MMLAECQGSCLSHWFLLVEPVACQLFFCPLLAFAHTPECVYTSPGGVHPPAALPGVL